MNELTIIESLPCVAGGLERIKMAYDGVKSFEDLENIFLRNQGLSPNTYKSYIAAVRRFYDFTEALHPFQWEAWHLERFYEYRRKQVSASTASIDMSGLQNFCKRVASQYPYQSPFEKLTDETRKKLFSKETGAQKKALLLKELEAVLRNADRLNGIIIRFAFTTGLRASELAQARLEDVQRDDINNRLLLAGLGKGKNGGKRFIVEIEEALLDSMKAWFKDTVGRDMEAEDTLLVSTRGRAFNRTTLWARLTTYGEKLKADGMIRQELEFSPHLFRRTFATLQLQANRATAEVQKAGRWSNQETMMKHYHDYQGGTLKFLNENIFSRIAN